MGDIDQLWREFFPITVECSAVSTIKQAFLATKFIVYLALYRHDRYTQHVNIAAAP
jgi:hypothetical protein